MVNVGENRLSTIDITGGIPLGIAARTEESAGGGERRLLGGARVVTFEGLKTPGEFALHLPDRRAVVVGDRDQILQVTQNIDRLLVRHLPRLRSPKCANCSAMRRAVARS